MLAKRKTKKHSLEEKLEAVKLKEEGFGVSKISSLLSIDLSLIKRWLNLYKVRGVEGFNKGSNIRPTPEIKQKIVKDVLENCLSSYPAGIKYRVSPSAIRSWVLQVKKYGYSSLNEIQPRGRPAKNMSRPKTKEPQTDMDKLQAEVEYLRAENAYLKKLRALVEKREARERERKPKPSNH